MFIHLEQKKKKKVDIKNLIKKFNPKYKILSINDVYSFYLRSSNLRKYYKYNILAFGELLHKLHPLAGQGFNMSLRDIKELIIIINNRINLGLELDNQVCFDFQKRTKNKNYLFSSGVDWIYEFFNFESKTKSNVISKSIFAIGKNKIINSFFQKYADRGI